MDIVQLKYFATLCRLQHMTQAADELFISQPALSSSMTRLEEELGVKLFNKKGRNIILSAQGKVVYTYVLKILNEYNAMMESISGQESLSHPIRFGRSSYRPFYILLTPFFRKYPNAQIRQFSLPLQELKKGLLDGQLDVCVSTPPITGHGINSQLLCKEELLVQIPLSHAVASKEHINITDFRNDIFMGFPKDYSLRNVIDSLCMQAGFIPHYAIELDTTQLNEFRRNAFAGQYVGIFPKSLCGSCVSAENTTVFRSINEPECYRYIGIAWSSMRSIKPMQQELINHLINYYTKSYHLNSISTSSVL